MDHNLLDGHAPMNICAAEIGLGELKKNGGGRKHKIRREREREMRGVVLEGVKGRGRVEYDQNILYS